MNIDLDRIKHDAFENELEKISLSKNLLLRASKASDVAYLKHAIKAKALENINPIESAKLKEMAGKHLNRGALFFRKAAV